MTSVVIFQNSLHDYNAIAAMADTVPVVEEYVSELAEHSHCAGNKYVRSV